jgi:hypothetical protein
MQAIGVLAVLEGLGTVYAVCSKARALDKGKALTYKHEIEIGVGDIL